MEVIPREANSVTSITVFDGANTIGGNKIFVEEKDRGVFLDFGMNFAKREVFFEEFLSERSSRGIHDPMYLDLIPRLNIYRGDLIPSDLDVSKYPRLNVEAVLLSHAHIDHCGNVGLLKEDLPVVASSTSLAIIKALRDTTQADIGSEIAYFSKKNPIESDGLVLESESAGAYIGRDFCCTNNISDELRDFVAQRPGRKKVEPGRLCHPEELDLPFDVRSCDVDHSIYGASAYVLKGDTTVAYTGDFRLHGKMADKTRAFVREARNASILITEGTRIGREDDDDSVTEETVFNNCLVAAEESKKLTVADFSARNFERLDMFIEIAKKTGRQLVITSKDAYMLHAIGCTEEDCRMNDGNVLIYSELKNRNKIKWESDVVFDRWSDRYVKHTQISDNPEEYVLCFSFFDMKHLLDIKTKGGVYIYSSSEAFSEEQEIDFKRLGKWLDLFELKPHGFQIVREGDNTIPKFTKGYHASGHASANDLEQMINQIAPDKIVPVHTEHPEWFKKRFDNVVIPQEGKPIKF